MVKTLWNSYPDEDRARSAIAALLASRAPVRQLCLLIGSGLRDTRDEPVGEFGAAAQPDDMVGTFGNVHRLRRQSAGGFAGDPERQREGSFADAERDVVICEQDGVQARLPGLREVRRLLRDTAGLDEHASDCIVAQLRVGQRGCRRTGGRAAAGDGGARLC